MATTEHSINDALAEVLRSTRRAWASEETVQSENTGMLKGNNKRPDILIVESNVSPVCIETEIMPASTVEKEAKSRLGEKLRRSGKSILSSIAVRLPQGLTSLHAEELRNQISEANDCEYALYTGVSPSECFRWPQQGWIEGDVRDLSILAQSATVPPKIIEEAVEALVAGLIPTALVVDRFGPLSGSD